MFITAKSFANRIIVPGFGRIELIAPQITEEAEPGQFVMVKFWRGAQPFFMRPFCINSADRETGHIHILYKVVGTGTELMSTVPDSTNIEVLGPLGHGFPIPENAKRIAVIGRGVGAAPMRFLAEEAQRRGIEIYAYMSAAKPEYLFDWVHFRELGCHYFASTDSNLWVTSVFEGDLKNLKFDAAYTCGSEPIAQKLALLSNKFGFPAYASLEAHMACGLGACKGCVVPIHDENGKEGYARVCKEGPVFPVQMVV